jgi:hypothetical protein
MGLRISSTRLVAYFVLLVVPSLVAFSLPLYNVANPTLAGVPFFYCFQTLLLAAATVPYLIGGIASGLILEYYESASTGALQTFYNTSIGGVFVAVIAVVINLALAVVLSLVTKGSRPTELV